MHTHHLVSDQGDVYCSRFRVVAEVVEVDGLTCCYGCPVGRGEENGIIRVALLARLYSSSRDNGGDET